MKAYALTVIGAGSWGTALALHLAKKGVSVCLWDNHALLLQNLQHDRCNRRYLPEHAFPDNLHVESSLEVAVKNAQDILLVVPSHAFSHVLSALSLHIELGMRIVWATKGIDPEHHVLLHTVVERVFSKAMPFAVLSGPSFAGEVAHGLPTAISIASNNEAFQQEMMTLFTTPTFSLYPTMDYIGVELGGAIKNVLAIAIGISDGLNQGANMRAALITLGVAEMIRLGQAMGARIETMMGLSGLGDLVLTCTDSQSRNRRFGLALGQKTAAETAEKTIGQAIEGKDNVAQVVVLAQKYHVNMPITETVLAILSGKEDAQKGLLKILAQ